MSILTLSTEEQMLIYNEKQNLNDHLQNVNEWKKQKVGQVYERLTKRIDAIEAECYNIDKQLNILLDYEENFITSLKYNSSEWHTFINLKKAYHHLSKLNDKYKRKLIQLASYDKLPKPKKPKTSYTTKRMETVKEKLKGVEPFTLTKASKTFIENSQYKEGDLIQFKSYDDYIEAEKIYFAYSNEYPPSKDFIKHLQKAYKDYLKATK